MKTILIVEDESRTVDMLRLILAKAGYQVISAENGQEGIEKAKNEHPDLIISDVLMPVMDGFAFLKELKKNPATVRIPVIILTARGHMEDAFLAFGADDFIEKPSETSVLLTKIKKHLSTEQKRPPVAKSSRRVLLVGMYQDVLAKMENFMQPFGCEMDFVYTGADVISRAVIFLPEIVVLDVQMDVVASAEIVRVFRLLPQLRQALIITYSFYHVSDLGSEHLHEKVEQIDACKMRCLEMGADEYIGRFTEQTFQRVMTKYF